MDKWNKYYNALRAYVGIFFRLFYKRIVVSGKEKIPKDKPVVFAPNHQNALMDPLAIVFTQLRQTIFLTRADIFQNPILLKIFTFLKMLPVYRIRDGKDNLKNNERVFNESVKILESKDKVALSLFPEATHNDKNFLKPLKKAIPRIVFQAEEKNNYKLDIHIVPVGIYYSEYEPAFAHIHINYGESFPISQYNDLYKENSQKAFNELRTKLSKEIKKQMLNIEDKENYDFYEHTRFLVFENVAEKHKLNKKNKELFIFKKIVETLYELKHEKAEKFNELLEKFNAYKEKCDAFNIETNINKFDNIIVKFVFNVLILVLGFPVFIYGLLNHFYIYLPLKQFLNKKVKDRQFHSSIKFGAMIFTPLIELIQAGIFAIFLPDYFWYYFISLPVSAYLSLRYKMYFFILRRQLRYYIFKFFNRRKYRRLKAEAIQLQKEILAEI